MKIMLICTTGGVVNNFRLDLIEALIASGHTVTVVADYSEVKPVKDNFEVVDISVDNKSNNVFSTLNYYYKVKKAVQSVGPDVVITFMIKPNTFGARAALKVKGVKVFSMIEGMGTVYTVNTVKYMLIRKITDFLYKSNMRKLDGLFCLNDYDADYFRGKFIPDNKLHVIPGIGLDTEKYAFSEITNHNVVAMFKGDKIRGTLVDTALFGALFVLVCDMIGRVVIFPYELPIELIVGILGSVIFVALLLYRLKNGRKQIKLRLGGQGGKCA